MTWRSSENPDDSEEHIARLQGQPAFEDVFLLLPFDPDDGGIMFSRNVRNFPNYTVLQPRRLYYSRPFAFLSNSIIHIHSPILVLPIQQKMKRYVNNNGSRKPRLRP
jgi:hypothetical protein